MNTCKEILNDLYNNDNYWLGLLGAIILVVTAPVVVPTRLIYRTFMALREYGL